MAYTPINWQTGDTITAEKMNKMDNGWSVDSSQLFSETVTMGDSGGLAWSELVYSTQITAETINITFDGTEYNDVPAIVETAPFGTVYTYGATWSDALGSYDFSVYPFSIESTSNGNSLYTQTSGTHTIAVAGAAIVVGDNFSTAVGISAEPLLATLPTPYAVTIGTTTLKEVFDALASGKIPIATHTDNMQNTPRYIEIFLYARTYNLTASSILLSNGALTVKNYTATNANSPIYEAE